MFIACKSSSDCTQSQVNTQETHVPNTTEQIKLAALQLLVSLCYRMSDTYLHQTSQWLLQCSSTKSAEPLTELVSPHKQSLPSSAHHFTSMPFSALFFALAFTFWHRLPLSSSVFFSTAWRFSCDSWWWSEFALHDWRLLLLPLPRDYCKASGMALPVTVRCCQPSWLLAYLLALDSQALAPIPYGSGAQGIIGN